MRSDLTESFTQTHFFSEIKTLKERYRNRRDKLTDIKNRVKSSMETQYESIIKEVLEVL